MTYTFNYYTGFGIGSISNHTIKFYPIEIKAKTIEDAIKQCKIRSSKLIRYNDCFSTQSTIPVIEKKGKEERIGIYFIKEGVIKWEGEILYWVPIAFGNQKLDSFILPTSDSKKRDSKWVTNYCNGRVYYSYKHWLLYSWDYFGGNKQNITERNKSDLQKYFYDEIDYLINETNVLGSLDKFELITIKNKKI